MVYGVSHVFINALEDATIIVIAHSCRKGDLRITIHIRHGFDVKFPVIFVILYDAQTIDLEIADIESPRGSDGILESLWQFRDRNS